MSKKEGYSRKGLFGNINHYDSSGRKIGESRPGLFGGMNNFDVNGHKTGSSCPGIFGGVPSDSMSNFALIELRRFYEYARLADNKDNCLEELEDLSIRYGIDMEVIMQTEDNEGDLDE